MERATLLDTLLSLLASIYFSYFNRIARKDETKKLFFILHISGINCSLCARTTLENVEFSGFVKLLKTQLVYEYIYTIPNKLIFRKKE